MPLLTVRKLDGDEANEDIVRIPRQHRNGIARNSVISLTANGETRKFYLLGKNGGKREIHMDLVSRNHFGVRAGDKVEFDISRAGYFGELVWR
jgi:hypothetical protein